MFMDFLVGVFADPLLLCGLLAAVLSTIAYLPYLIDTLKGRTQPERSTWLIWAFVSSVALASQIYEGAERSLGFVIVQVGATVIVFVLSIWLGSGGYRCKRSIWLFAITGIGMVVWYLAEDAFVMLCITSGISLMGGGVTAVKAYKAPDSETMSTWILSLAASFFAMIAVGKMDASLLIYPIYLYVLYSAIIVATLAGRAQQRAYAPAARWSIA